MKITKNNAPKPSRCKWFVEICWDFTELSSSKTTSFNTELWWSRLAISLAWFFKSLLFSILLIFSAKISLWISSILIVEMFSRTVVCSWQRRKNLFLMLYKWRGYILIPCYSGMALLLKLEFQSEELVLWFSNHHL